MSEAQTTPRQEMCGLGVTTEQLANCQGYTLHIDNHSDQQLDVDFDFAGSENLEISTNNNTSGIEVKGELLATVKAAAGETDLQLTLSQKDRTQGIALSIAAAPAAETVTTVLECGVVMTTSSLPSCKGYRLTFNNPTEEAMTLEFDFSKSENLSTTAAGSSNVDGMNASTSVPAGADNYDFVLLETIDITKPIAMEYNLASYPTKDANPEQKRDVLKCGAGLTLQPLPKAGGYEFSFDNETDKRHTLKFDFAKSDNLRLENIAEASNVTIDGTCATVVLAPHIMKPTPCFKLVSVDKTKGVQMNYSLQSQTEDS